MCVGSGPAGTFNGKLKNVAGASILGIGEVNRLSCLGVLWVTLPYYMRVEQKVHERGFLCVSLWVCNEQSRLIFFSEMAKYFFLAKVLAKVHVDMFDFAL